MNVGTIRSNVWTKPQKLESFSSDAHNVTAGIKAIYVPKTPAGCNGNNFGNKTYVTWNGHPTGEPLSSEANAVNYSAHTVGTHVPTMQYDRNIPAYASQSINAPLDMMFPLIQDGSISGYLTDRGLSSDFVTVRASGAPTMAALNGKLYIFWKDRRTQTLRYKWVPCNSVGGLSWRATQTLEIRACLKIQKDFILRELFTKKKCTTNPSKCSHCPMFRSEKKRPWSFPQSSWGQAP